MDEHMEIGLDLEPISFEIKDLPDGITFDDLSINDQRLIHACALQKQISNIQGTKIALLCMHKVSLYDTYEEALAVQKSCPYLDSMIYFPSSGPSSLSGPPDAIDDFLRKYS